MCNRPIVVLALPNNFLLVPENTADCLKTFLNVLEFMNESRRSYQKLIKDGVILWIFWKKNLTELTYWGLD